jgi:hypothetical protein
MKFLLLVNLFIQGRFFNYLFFLVYFFIIVHIKKITWFNLPIYFETVIENKLF